MHKAAFCQEKFAIYCNYTAIHQYIVLIHKLSTICGQLVDNCAYQDIFF